MKMMSRRLSATPLLAGLLLPAFASAQIAAEAPPAAGAPVAAPGTPAPASAPAPEAKPAIAFEEELNQFTSPGGLTSVQVAEKAIASSASLEAKREAVRGVEAQRQATLARFYPKLTGSARYTRLSEITMPSFGATPAGVNPVYATTEGPITINPATGQPNQTLFAAASPGQTFPVILNQYELKASLALPLSDWVFRLSSALSGAGKLRESTEASERAERLMIATNAKIAYYDWVKALGAAYVMEKMETQLKSQVEDTKRAFTLGTASKADVLRAESGLMKAEQAKIKTAHFVALAEQQLRMYMSDDSPGPFKVGEPMLEDVKLPEVESLEAAIKEARSKRTELVALSKLEESWEDATFLSKVDALPRLDALGNLFTANPNPRIFPQQDVFTPGWDVSLMLTWTPTDIPGAYASAAVNSSKAAETRAQKQQLLNALRVEVAAALNEAENAKMSVKTAEEILRSAEEGYRVRRELFKVGRATMLEVADAETSLAQARFDLVASKMDAKISRVRLLHVLGRDTEESSKQAK